MTQFKLNWYGDKVLADFRKATPESIFEGAEELVEVAADKAPRQSGDLAASGYVSGAGKSTYRNADNHNREVKGDAQTIVAGFAAFYARFIELGTKRRSAQPFLRPAIDEMKDKIGVSIVGRIKRRVDK